MNKTRLAEKRYRDKLKKDKKELRLNTKTHKKQNKEDYKKYNRQLQKTKKSTKLQKTKKSTKLQKKKEYELNRRRKLIRRQNESNREKNKMKDGKNEKI